MKQKQCNTKEGCASKTMGILSIVIGCLIPFIGIILGIIGLSLHKPQDQKNNCITLNIVGIVVSIGSWIFWFSVLIGLMMGV